MAQKEEYALRLDERHPAFKSYTQILATIPQRNQPDVDIVARNPTKDQYKTVKICDAYCQLIVGEHNVSACATGVAVGEDLRLAISLNPSETGTDIKGAPSSNSFFRFIVTSNAERTVKTPVPIFELPKKPENMTTDSVYKYAASLQDKWQDLSIPNHIWLVSEMLGRAHKELPCPLKLAKVLGEYSVVASRGRILRRFKKGASFLDILAAVKFRNLDSIHVPPNTIHIQSENEADHYILRLLESHRTKPNDTKKYFEPVEVAVPVDLEHDERNTKDFHAILVELLRQFRDGLQLIDSIIAQKNSGSIKSALIGTYFAAFSLWRVRDTKFFKQHLQYIDSDLEDLSKLYLTIESDEKPDPASGETQDAKDRREVEEGLRRLRGIPRSGKAREAYKLWITLLVNVISSSSLLSRFATSDRRQFDTISVITMTTPHPKQNLLNWDAAILSTSKPDAQYVVGQSDAREIVRKLRILNHVFVTAKQASNTFKDYQQKWQKSELSNVTASGVITANSLKLLQPPQSKTRLFTNVPEKINLDENPDPDAELKALPQKISINTAWAELHGELHSFKADSQLPLKQKEITSITEKFTALNKKLEALTTGDYQTVASICKLTDSRGFTGTVHCEMSLSTILPQYSNKISPSLPFHLEIQKAVQDLKFSLEGFGQEIGVSKRCCPVCYQFLSEMMTSVKAPAKDHYHVAGHHELYSACALPPWTPDPVIDRMIARYGLIVNKTLTAFLENFGRDDERARRDSTSSAPISDLGSENDYW